MTSSSAPLLTASPRLAPVRLPQLSQTPPAEVELGEADLEAAEIAGFHCEQLHWTGRRRLAESRLGDLRVAKWRAHGARFASSILEQVEVVSLVAPGSSWQKVELRRSRIGAAELYDSVWRGVRFVGCKFGFLNLRDAKLEDVAFADCILDGVDLTRATASRVNFDGCRIGLLETRQAQLSDFDLRGATLAEVGTVADLRGATVSVEQLLDLAPLLAAGIGLRIE